MTVLDLLRGNLFFALSAGLAGAFLVLMFTKMVFGNRRTAATARTDSTVTPADKQGLERRASLRRRGRELPALISDEEASAQPVQGLVLDRSGGGLCLTMKEPRPVGTILSVRAADAPVTTPWVQVEVRYCRAHDHEWEHGCAFVKVPSWGVLLQFG